MHVSACMFHALRGWPHDLHPWLPPAGGGHPWKPMRKTSVLDGAYVAREGIHDSVVPRLQCISRLRKTSSSVSVSQHPRMLSPSLKRLCYGVIPTRAVGVFTCIPHISINFLLCERRIPTM